jgi:hypothetical protein
VRVTNEVVRRRNGDSFFTTGNCTEPEGEDTKSGGHAIR